MIKSFISLFARLASVATVLIGSAVVARNFTPAEFGLWAVLQSIFLIGQNFDFGLRFGMGNRLAALSGGSTSKSTEIRRVYFAVFNAICLFAIIASLIAWPISINLPWAKFFAVTDLSVGHQIGALLPGVVVLLLFSLPFNLASTVFFSNQEIGLASTLTVMNSMGLLASLWISSHFHSFTLLIWAFFICNVLLSIAGTAILWIMRGWVWQWISLVDQKYIISTFIRPSLKFFGLNIASVVTGAMGTFISGNIFGLVVAGQFSLFQRAFNILNTVHLAVLAPISPEYTRLARMGEWGLITRKHLALLKWLWPAIFILGGGILFMLHPLVLYIWTGQQIRDYRLAAIFWALMALQGWINAHSVMLNSLGVVGFQGVCVMIMFLPNIVLPYFFSKYWGEIGIALGLVVCLLPLAIIWTRMVTKVVRHRICSV